MGCPKYRPDFKILLFLSYMLFQHGTFLATLVNAHAECYNKGRTYGTFDLDILGNLQNLNTKI